MSGAVVIGAATWIAAVVACALIYANNRRGDPAAPSIWESDTYLAPAPRRQNASTQATSKPRSAYPG